MSFAKRLMVFLLILILLGVLSVYWPNISGNSISNINAKVSYVKEQAFVTKIVDGDTIHVKINGNDKEETIRFLGINTPEKKKPYYQEAKDFLTNNIENKSVELLRDINNDDLDRYGRKLRYVFYEDRLINVEIVEKGLATTFMLDKLKYSDKFVFAEKFAKNSEIGLWKRSSDKCSFCIKLVELKPEIDYFIIKNSCDFECDLNNWVVKDDANHFFQLKDFEAGESRKYDSLAIFKTEVWNDDHDRFFMRDDNGELVIFYDY